MTARSSLPRRFRHAAEAGVWGKTSALWIDSVLFAQGIGAAGRLQSVQ